MARIRLEVARAFHQPSLAAEHSLPVVRFLVDMRLRTTDGWTPAHKAVIDTGATVSLFPKTVWQNAAFHSIIAVRAAGVVNRPECTVSANLATVDCALMHESEQFGPFAIHALLADSDRVPLLLGTSGILDRLRLHIDLPNSTAYLEAV